MSNLFYSAILATSLLMSAGGFSAYAQHAPTQQSAASVCRGSVFDAQGEPVIGANIRVDGSNQAATTDVEGNFNIPGVKPGSTIVINAIGFSTKIVKWDGKNLKITLDDQLNTLDEMVVVGYGVQKKANLTGSVASVKAETIEDRTVASVSAAMAGQIPGVVVVQSSGAPGSQTGSVTIRGNNTVNSASPLIIVDGVPGSWNNIDPQDVESISVLKDAASAAIYGVQAANGVILVTTKKGKNNQAATISYSGSVSSVAPTTRLKKVNAYEHVYLMRQATLNENPSADVSAYDELIKKYQNGTLDKEGTDWWKETFKSSGTETAHTVQINGGNANTTYMASLGYLFQGGLLDDTNYNRYNGRINLESKLKPWLAAGVNASYYRGISKDNYIGFSSIVQYVNRLNATGTVYDEDGNYMSNGGMQNPVACIGGASGTYRSVADQLFTNLYLDITPIPGLSIRPLFSWRHDTSDIYAYRKYLNYDGNYNNGTNGTRYAYHNIYNYEWLTYQVLANYTRQFGQHGLNILGGFESQKYFNRFLTANRTGGGDNELTEVFNSLDKDQMSNSDYGYKLTRQSWFGRIQYDFDSKYLFEANFRADASSRFPSKNRWGYFPAVSAAWRLSQESFMESTRDWLSNAKIRLGWGKTGNEEIDSYYPSVATYAYYTLLIGQSQYTTLYESSLVNSDLKWATVTNYELGLDLGFLDNRFTFEGNFYRKKTEGMLLTLPIMSVIGMSAVPSNAGSVENKGFEITLGYNQRITKDFSVNVTGNIGYNHNEILDLCGTDGVDPNNSLQWFIVGEQIGSYYGLLCDGIFKDEAEVAAGPLRTGNEKPGNLRYKDINGDGKIDNDDRTVIGHSNPSWMGGMNIGLTYRDFDLSMLWQAAWDVERYMNGEAAFAFYNNGTALKWHLDAWSEDNPNGSYPRLYTSSASSPDVAATNSFWCMNASYLRLKNLTIGYTLPKNITNVIGINKVRLFLNGENLLTFSSLYDKGIDPESPAGRGAFYSNVRKYSFGLKVTF